LFLKYYDIININKKFKAFYFISLNSFEFFHFLSDYGILILSFLGIIYYYYFWKYVENDITFHNNGLCVLNIWNIIRQHTLILLSIYSKKINLFNKAKSEIN